MTGDFYDGEFKSDRAEGKGAYYSHDGNVYIGEWKNDMRNGRGTYVFANGSKYTGNWSTTFSHRDEWSYITLAAFHLQGR